MLCRSVVLHIVELLHIQLSPYIYRLSLQQKSI